MPLFAGETCVDVCNAEIFGQLRADDARTKHQDVGVVVFHALVGGICVMAEPGAYSGNLVGGH